MSSLKSQFFLSNRIKKISSLFLAVNFTNKKLNGSSVANEYICNITSLGAIAETSSKKWLNHYNFLV